MKNIAVVVDNSICWKNFVNDLSKKEIDFACADYVTMNNGDKYIKILEDKNMLLGRRFDLIIDYRAFSKELISRLTGQDLVIGNSYFMKVGTYNVAIESEKQKKEHNEN